MTDDYTVIGRNLFKKETNLQLFVGLKVTLSTGEGGVIEGGFGQSGKFKIRVPGKEFLEVSYCFLLHVSQQEKTYWCRKYQTYLGLSVIFSLTLTA